MRSHCAQLSTPQAEGPFGRFLGPGVKDIVVAFINLMARNIYHGRLIFKPAPVPRELQEWYTSVEDLPDCQLKGYEGWKVGVCHR